MGSLQTGSLSLTKSIATHMEPEDQRAGFLCPTFTTTDKSAETAARVATSAYLEESDADFEFDTVRTDVSLDDVLREGADVFPVFNRDLLPGHVDDSRSSTASDDGEPEGVATWSYCVWRPKKPEETSLGRVKKSGSTGSGSKRWKLLDLLRRSNSDGKGNFVFLTPNNRDPVKSKTDDKGNFVFSTPRSGEAVKPKGKGSAVEAFYVRNRASKEGQKWKSYLPYKKDLVGFFATVKGTGKS